MSDASIRETNTDNLFKENPISESYFILYSKTSEYFVRINTQSV